MGDLNPETGTQAPAPHAVGNKALLLPLGFSALLACFALLPSARENPKVLASILGTAGVLVVWNAALLLWTRERHRKLILDLVPKKQHYLQACAQGSVLVYWGWYWPPAHAYAPFILAQLVFAYAFDILLGWSRREDYTLGFAQFPVVFSTNLFLWFKPDWIYLQFAMIGLGLAAKDLIRWTKDGRRVHIFNPSSFPLAVFSLALVATGKSGMTWGQDIASTQFYPPHIYLMLFLIGLPAAFFFGVASMTMSAVIAAYAFSRIYFGMTGIYFFYDSYIPIAVFLGMHLLFNDPSTSPRTELGRIIYGALYGLSTAGLYQLLGSMGMPTFYDKLLQVPILNLSIKGIDRLARSKLLSRFDPGALGRSMLPRRRNLVYMSIWAGVFAILSGVQGVGDNHPGQWLPFWRQACMDGRAYACPYLADMDQRYCDNGSGWACNEAGLMDIALSRSGEDQRRLDPAKSAAPFRRGCDLGLATACRNLAVLNSGAGSYAATQPKLEDYPIILRGSKGEIEEREPAKLYALACKEGWPGTCGTAGQ